MSLRASKLAMPLIAALARRLIIRTSLTFIYGRRSLKRRAVTRHRGIYNVLQSRFESDDRFGVSPRLAHRRQRASRGVKRLQILRNRRDSA